MADTEVLPDIKREEKTGSKSEAEPGWLVICWNDPVNLMTTTRVLQTVFGWSNKGRGSHAGASAGKSSLARGRWNKPSITSQL
jgi:hypothetical protein